MRKKFGSARPATFIAAGLFIVISLGRLTTSAAAEPLLLWVNDSADTNRWNVEVTRLTSSALQRLRGFNWTRAQWEQLLSVRVVQDDPLSDIGLPAMLGRYVVEDRMVRFIPQFPVRAGLKYRA